MEVKRQGPGKRVRVYRCTVCKETKDREDLVAKKINFVKLGVGGRLVRSRTKHWLCPECLEDDPDWDLEDFRAPGNTQYEPEHLL